MLIKYAYEGYKGTNALAPTGPLLLGEILHPAAFTEEFLPFRQVHLGIEDRTTNIKIFDTYPEYRNEQVKAGIRDETNYAYAWERETYINPFALEPLRELKTLKDMF